MATVVYQGYQSYFESQHFEPRALRLRLSSPNTPPLSTPLKSSQSLDSSFITPQENITITTNAPSLSSASNSESWSFLEALSKPSSDDDKEKKTLLSPYVQPKSSRRTLSDESLALCTESLGSETGSDVIDDEDLFSNVSSESQQTLEGRTMSTTRSRLSAQVRKSNVMASLPPPLTSMSGADGIQVKSHRENGRLVMTAARAPPRNRCLQDRSNGCVRLAILVDSCDDQIVESETKEEDETIETEELEEEEVVEEVEKEEEIKVISIEKVQRSRRCVEGDRENRGFLNWESFCVATS